MKRPTAPARILRQRPPGQGPQGRKNGVPGADCRGSVACPLQGLGRDDPQGLRGGPDDLSPLRREDESRGFPDRVRGRRPDHLLLRQSGQWVLAANLIAWPVAFFLMKRWLRDFAYRTDIGPWPFLAAGILVFVLTCLAGGGKAFRAARAEPARSLRYE
jgi:hypothetical protein